ncbi:zinc-dependent alcohol dehydrogenase family protein [Thermodesulfobacteriota bacterium]
MVLKEICEIDVQGEKRSQADIPLKKDPLELMELPDPIPGPGQVLVKVSACGVCHTELDEIEGRLMPQMFPLVLGHEVVGRVVGFGPGAKKYQEGDRVGIVWIYSSCKDCEFCNMGLENLCKHFEATGLDANGGYAQYMVVSENFAYPIPKIFPDSQAAPLLCAGVIGYRALKLSGLKPGNTLGLYGFGASAHIAIQIAKFQGCKVFVFSRKDSNKHQNLALELGADWVGSTEDTPPEKLSCAIDFTPVGDPVRQALQNIKKGGRVVINSIRKVGPIPELEYEQYLWHEKELKSVANVTRQDALEFLPLAAEIGIKPEAVEFEMERANEVLGLLKQGRIHGAGVLKIPD